MPVYSVELAAKIKKIFFPFVSCNTTVAFPIQTTAEGGGV